MIEVVGSVVSEQPYNGTDPSALRGMGVWFVASGGSLTSEPNGYLCQARGDLAAGTTTMSLHRQISGVETLLDSDTVPQTLPAGSIGRIRVAIPVGPGFELCTADLGNGTIISTLTATDSTYASGGIALRTTSVHVRIDSIMIVGSGPSTTD